MVDVKKGCPIRPTRGHCVAIRVEAPGSGKGPIVVPDAIKAKREVESGFAGIVAVGEGDFNLQGNVVAPPCKVDDVVIVPPAIGFCVKLAGKKFYMLPFGHILGVLE